MATLERTVEIRAPAETVFDFVVAQWEANMSFWQGGVYKWTPLTRGAMGDGFRVRYVARMLGVGFQIEMEVEDFLRYEGWVAVSRKGPSAEGRWRFVSDDGKTRFTYGLSYDLPPPVIGPLMDRLLMKRLWSNAIDRSLANLKRLIESGDNDPPLHGAA
jgi:ligand-binding SRPBCC domain-containing protein